MAWQQLELRILGRTAWPVEYDFQPKEGAGAGMETNPADPSYLLRCHPDMDLFPCGDLDGGIGDDQTWGAGFWSFHSTDYGILITVYRR